MPILMLGCKGLLLQMRPFPLIEKWFREKNIFLCGPRKKVINLWKGHKANNTRGESCWRSFRGHYVTFRFCINFENKFLFMTPPTILSANVSRRTKKKSYKKWNLKVKLEKRRVKFINDFYIHCWVYLRLHWMRCWTVICKNELLPPTSETNKLGNYLYQVQILIRINYWIE